MKSASSKKAPSLPQLERDTALVPIAVARNVVEEASRWLGVVLPTRYATYLAQNTLQVYAHSPNFRRRLRSSGNRGRDWLYCFHRHWLAARLKAECPPLFEQLPYKYAMGRAPE